MRKVSILSIIGTVAFLMLAASIPQLRIPLAVLAIAINSLAYIFLAGPGGGDGRFAGISGLES